MSGRAFLQHFDANDLVMSATAYYLGRSTALVQSHCDSLIKAWPQLDQHVKDFVKRIVEDAIRRERWSFTGDGILTTGSDYVPPLGHEMDRKMWLKVRQLWQAKE